MKLQQWAEKELPRRCVAIGHRVLLEEFQNLIDRELKKASHDPIADDLKTHVVDACRTRHQWDAKALDSLVSIAVLLRQPSTFLFQRVIQTQALQDRNISDKQQWELASKFMENVVRQELQHQESELDSKVNQSSWKKFFGLQQTTMEEKYRQHCIKELQKVLLSRQQLDRSAATHTSVVG